MARLIWGSEPLRYPSLFAKRGIDIGGFAISPQLIWIVVLGFAMMALLQLFFRYTRLGVAMQAAAQDPEAAQLMGVNVKRTTTYTFLVAGVMAGAAGVLLGSLFFASFNMGFLIGIKAFVAATIGGLGSLTGAMLGGIAFGLIETFSGVLISTAYKDAVGMGLLITILLLAPAGIFVRLAAGFESAHEIQRRQSARSRCLCGGPFVQTNGYWLHVLCVALIGAILALGLQLLVGMAGLLSLGQAAFYGIGAYVSAVLTLRFDVRF